MTHASSTHRISLRGLRATSIQAGGITVSTQAIIALIQLAATVVLARLLTPGDFGVIAMVLAISAFAGIFRDLGLSTAAVQAETLDHAQRNALFWVNVAAGLGLSLLFAAASPLIARLYGRPELRGLALFLSMTFLLSSLGSQASALLRREFQFGRRAIAHISGAMVTTGLSITMALRGHGYWALAWGSVAGAAVTSMLLLSLSSFRPGLPRRSPGIGAFFRFGGDVTAFELVNYFHRNLDNILIGRMAGASALGLYSRAYQLLMLPVVMFRNPIISVAYPALSRLTRRPEEFRTYFLRSAFVLALVTMPLTAFMGVAAKPLVELVLGAQWTDAVPIFQMLAIGGFVQPAAGLRGAVMLSTGRTRSYLHWGIFNAVAMSVAYLAGIHWGPLGVAIAYSVATYLLLYPSLLIAFRDTALRSPDFFNGVGRPALASCAASAVTAMSLNIFDGSPPWLVVSCLALVFAASFLLALVALPGGIRELRYAMGLLAALLPNARVEAGNERGTP